MRGPKPPCVLGVRVEDNMNFICTINKGELLQILFIYRLLRSVLINFNKKINKK